MDHDRLTRERQSPRPAPVPRPVADRGLLGLQRRAGNAAVAQWVGGHTVQRCGPVPCDCPPEERAAAASEQIAQRQLAQRQVAQRQAPADVQRQQAPAPTVQVTRPQALVPLLDQWRTAGLLDPPYRPDDVGAFEPLTLPGTTPVEARLAPTPGLVGPLPRPPVTAPAPAPAPAPGPGALPEPFPIPPWLGGLAVFLLITLTPTPTAPPWMDEINQITGLPYGSPEEYRWMQRLSEPQREYLRHLVRSRRVVPDAAADGDVDPRVLPQPEPQPRRREPVSCFALAVPRRGGHARHDAYATKVTGTPDDYFVRTPEQLKINYDGLQDPRQVWEVKVGFGWFFNPDLAGVRDATLARWDAQKNLGLAVAARCGYVHLWAHPDRHVARLVTTRWGGVPPVLNLPE